MGNSVFTIYRMWGGGGGGVQDYQALVETVLLVKNTKLVLFSAYGSSFYDIYFGFNVGPLAVDFLSNS